MKQPKPRLKKISRYDHFCYLWAEWKALELVNSEGRSQMVRCGRRRFRRFWNDARVRL